MLSSQCTAAASVGADSAAERLAVDGALDGAAQLKELARMKCERRDAKAAAVARAASCQVRVELHEEGCAAVGAQLASGVLLRLPCGPCLVTAAHALGEDEAARRSCAARISGVAAVLPGHQNWFSRECGNERSSQHLASGAVRFKGYPSCFWRHDRVLDVVIVAVRANSARRTHRLREVSLPLEQLASAASLRGWTQGSPVQLTHRLGITVAIMRSAASCGDTRAGSLQTRGGAPLILDYDAPLVAGTSGAAVYDTRWRLVGVHVRGDEVEARGRGVSIDAVRELIEVGNKVPLSTRVRLVQPKIMLATSGSHGHAEASRSREDVATAAAAVSPERVTAASNRNVEDVPAHITENNQANVAHAWSMPLVSTRIIATAGVSGWKPRSSGRRVLDDHVRQSEQVHRPASTPTQSSSLDAVNQQTPLLPRDSVEERDKRQLSRVAVGREGAPVATRSGHCDAGSDTTLVSLQALALRKAARAAREAVSQQLRSTDVCRC